MISLLTDWQDSGGGNDDPSCCQLAKSDDCI